MTEQRSPDTPDTDQIPVQADPRVPAPNQPGPPAPVSEPGPSATEPAAPAGQHPYHKVRRTRVSGLWITVTVAAVVLLVLLVFIIENGQRVDISFFGAHGRLPLGVALLLAAICGVLLVAVPGYGRILQLRKALRKTGASRPE